MKNKLLDSRFIESGREINGWVVTERMLPYMGYKGYVMYGIKCLNCGHVVLCKGTSLLKCKTPKCKFCEKRQRTAKQGERFGHLTITRLLEEKEDSSKNIYECFCDCGNTVNVRWASLRDGHTKSCGHLKIKKGDNNPNYKHGGRGDTLYNSYRAMKERCYNPNYHHYERYGGRGITVCDEWRTNYTSFRNWAYSNGYQEGLSIDRINNDGNYCPENCRWTTQKEQVRNSTRSCHDKKGQALTELLEKQDIKGLRAEGLRLWRTVVKNRAKGLCEFCGLKGTDAHHWYYTKAQHSVTDIMPANGIFLCRGCHIIAHNNILKTKNRIKKMRYPVFNNLVEDALIKGRQKIATAQDYYNIMQKIRSRYKEFLKEKKDKP